MKRANLCQAMPEMDPLWRPATCLKRLFAFTLHFMALPASVDQENTETLSLCEAPDMLCAL